MAEIQFGTPDSSGDYPFSLGSPRPTPANRFFSFVPDVVIEGPRETTVGDGAQHVFAFRTDYTAAVSIKHLNPGLLDDALALKLWMIGGGAVKLVTDDATATTYVCTLRPGTTPEIVNEDDRRLHYTFRCEVIKTTAILVDYNV